MHIRRTFRNATFANATVAALALTGAASCHQNKALGPPDSYVVYQPVFDESSSVRLSTGGQPLFELMPLDSELASPLHKQIAVGFVGEMVRTDYFAKQLVRELALAGRSYAAPVRASAGEPTVFVIGRGMPPVGDGFATKGFFGGAVDHPAAQWIGLRDTLATDRALPQTATEAIARRIAGRITGDPVAPLVEAYVRAMEVIAREWRVGEGPSGAVAPDAGTGPQRAIFSGVRENSYATRSDGQVRTGVEQLGDPGLVATVLYRMAQSKLVGRKVGPADIYASFVTQRVPPGVSPAAVLGPFRNFQAKLLTAWARAVVAGTPPRDIIDLVDAYARALPDERGEVWRLFIVTTYGATVLPGGIDVRDGVDAALPALTLTAAEVASGRKSPRAALTP